MKAVYLTEHGSIEKLPYSELPDAVAQEREVPVRARACGVNHADLWFRPGMTLLRPQLPFIPGGRGRSGEASTCRISASRRHDPATVEW
jgi:NADPH:quinone reductase-like Zn-dependent oxidoreductase